MNHVHTEACVWKIQTNGKRRCQTRRSERERAHRAERALILKEWNAVAEEGRRFLRDGFEAQFGPMPKKEPDAVWYDWVAVERAFRGEKVGRELYPLEVAAVARRHVKAERKTA